MPIRSYTFDLPERLHDDVGRVAGVTAIVGPDEAGPFPTEKEIEAVVVHALHFNKRVLSVYCLGDNLPPIVVAKGQVKTYLAGERRYSEDDDRIHYCLNGYGFSSLGSALVFAMALRDRHGEPNDASHTATAIERLLTAVD